MRDKSDYGASQRRKRAIIYNNDLEFRCSGALSVDRTAWARYCAACMRLKGRQELRREAN